MRRLTGAFGLLTLVMALLTAALLSAPEGAQGSTGLAEQSSQAPVHNSVGRPPTQGDSAARSDGGIPPVEISAIDADAESSQTPRTAATGLLRPLAPEQCISVTNAAFVWAPIAPRVSESVHFTGTATGTLPMSYTWAFGDGAYGSGQSISHAYASGGDFTVVLTVSNPCGEDVLSHTLHVCTPAAGAAFSWSPITPTVGQSVAFSATASGEEPFSFVWNFGDGTADYGPNPLHTYTRPGRYAVAVTATNPCGQSTASSFLLVAGPIHLPVIYKHYYSCLLGPGEVEPNNSPSQATGPLCPNRQYEGFPNDAEDWFSVYAQAGTVTVDMWDYAPGAQGQLILYDHSLHLLAVDNDPTDGWHLEADVGPGKYFIRIYTAGGFTDILPYKLQATFPIVAGMELPHAADCRSTSPTSSEDRPGRTALFLRPEPNLAARVRAGNAPGHRTARLLCQAM
mgnify:CR=1 FL=1